MPGVIATDISSVFPRGIGVHDRKHASFYNGYYRAVISPSSKHVTVKVDSKVSVGDCHRTLAKPRRVVVEITIKNVLDRRVSSEVASVYTRGINVGRQLHSNVPHRREIAFFVKLSVDVDRRLRLRFDRRTVLCDRASLLHLFFDRFEERQFLCR